jgi:hypothetical protein
LGSSFRVGGTAFTGSKWTAGTPSTNIYYNLGNVGIGTTNPLAKLHIVNSSTATNPDSGVTGLYVYNPTNTAGQNSVITNRIGGSTAGSVIYGFDVSAAYGYSIKMNGNSSALRFNNGWNGEGTDRMTLATDGTLSTTNGVWHSSMEGSARVYYAASSTTYLRGHGANPFTFRNGADADLGYINSSGAFYMYGGINVSSGANVSGDLAVSSSRISLRGTSPTLYLRDTDNRSSMIHCNGNNLYFLNASGNDSETWTQQNGQDWALRLNMDNNDAVFGGQIYAYMVAVANSGTDYLCVQRNFGSGEGAGGQRICVAFGSFTAFHRCYTDDVLYNNTTDEDIDLFKNKYMGRVVIATGKIKTDLSREKANTDKEPKLDPLSGLPMPQNREEEWYSGIDKDGISIEDAIPIVALSRKKKDKRVFGVLGDPKRNTNNPNRLIVNSIGEGGIYVSNTNGNIENGDYIQSSDLLGYGEKQDDDLLHNYTIAKATIDCNFELNSPYYQCHEIENGVRVAFIACSYHCG